MGDRTTDERLAALRAYADKGPSVSRSDVGWVLGELERLRGPETATQLPISGRGWGKTTAQADMVDAALRRGESIDRVSAEGVEHLDPDDDLSLCDQWCPAGAGGPHRHAPRQ